MRRIIIIVKPTKIQTVTLPNGVVLSGYEGEYVFERISSAQAFYEQPILEKWFPTDSATIIYDIGANIGNHTVYFATESRNAQIYSFEPMPENFKILEKNISDNKQNGRVRAFQMAIGEEGGMVSMRIMKDGNFGTASVVEANAADNTHLVEVQLASIDSLGLPPPDFVKIDVEGYELSVLRGMRETLKNAGELSLWIEVDTETSSEVYEFMSGLGFSVSDVELVQNNNALWCNRGESAIQESMVFRHLLAQSEISRQRFWDARDARSKFTYEQKKANDLTGQLQSMTSKYAYEQKKADDLTGQLQSMTSKYAYEQKVLAETTGQLQSMTSKYAYEQNKATDLTEQLQSMTSKYTYEQKMLAEMTGQLQSMTSKYTYEQKTLVETRIKLAEFVGIQKDLTGQLQSMTSKYAYEQKKADELTGQLSLMTSRFAYEQDKVTDLQGKADDLTGQLMSMTSKFTYEQRMLAETRAKVASMQKNLDMFNNSKMISFMRFWVWRVPTAIRRRARNRLNRFGKWLYVKLLPYPRIRRLCSRINGRLKIYKNPQAVTAVQQKTASQPPTTKKQKRSGKLNVAMICDEFTFNSFRDECNAFPLEPDNWREIFEKQEIDFFFCESAWSGVDSIKRPWRGQVYASANFAKENRGILLEILSYCKANRTPTVFWNKEDPAHYDDRIHDFVKTALEFDHIFTTAAECVERYKSEYGHKSVHLLMFATQPKLFNPIEKFERTEEIIFAGSWYNQHPARCDEMGAIFDAIIQSPNPLKIYNRHSGNDDPNHAFPEKYAPYIQPRLPHDNLDAAYKASKYALNVNTVTNSETMFARRVFELMSSNTLVLSNYSKGMELLFEDGVVFVDGSSPPDLSGEAEKREKYLYNVLTYHTYRHRFEQVLKVIGFDCPEPPTVSLYYTVTDADEAGKAADHFYRMDWLNKRGVLVADEKCAPDELQKIVCGYNGGMIAVQSAHYNKTYGDRIHSAADYRIYATTDLNSGFIKKAMAHVCYLDNSTAIVEENEKYVFMPAGTNAGVNALIPAGAAEEEVEKIYAI